jgi:predicted CopG family antitoxin
MHDSCASKTITIEEDVYKLLRALKKAKGDTFTKVLRRHLNKPAETAAELLDAYAGGASPKGKPGQF